MRGSQIKRNLNNPIKSGEGKKNKESKKKKKDKEATNSKDSSGSKTNWPQNQQNKKNNPKKEKAAKKEAQKESKKQKNKEKNSQKGSQHASKPCSPPIETQNVTNFKEQLRNTIDSKRKTKAEREKNIQVRIDFLRLRSKAWWKRIIQNKK